MDKSYVSQRGGGKIGTIITLLFIAGAVIYLIKNAPSSGDDKILKENQSDPEKALVYYLRTAYKYVHDEQPGGTITDVQNSVTKDDWQWFNDNDTKLFKESDFTNSGKVLGADQNAMLSRIAVLHRIFDMGPDRPDNQIVNREIGPERSVFTVRKVEGTDPNIYSEYKVEVVKEGPFWKVKDFAGARTSLSKVQ